MTLNNRRDTGRAKLPALPPLNAADPKSVATWAQRVAERFEVREGARGNPAERAVTLRELQALQDAMDAMTKVVDPPPGSIPVTMAGGLTASVAIEQFVEAIRGTRLYRDLMKRVDDTSRFDAIVEPVREVLLHSIADEAKARSAAIIRIDTRMQSAEQSLSMAVEELTAALGAQAAGLRQTQFAYADADRAQAGQITQIESSLGNYYQDGAAGRASLEEAMTTSAGRVDGLRAQYTLKVQAGGALAGYGLAAEEVNGVPASAFIISADKFAIVAPGYTGGLTATPDNNLIPFGVDANGIYLNTNVYIKGTTKIDAGGKTIIQGLRGSLATIYTAATWSDAAASQAVWTALGKASSPTNTNHLVIGDSVTRTNGANPPSMETRYWNDTAWVAQGAFINGDMLVNGSIAATKINTRGLDIRDAAGNIIFSSGNNLDYSRIGGAKPPSDADNTGSNISAGIWNQGSFATMNQINSGNQGTLIANLSVGSLKLARVAVNYAYVTLSGGVGYANINHGLGQNPIAVTLAWVSPIDTPTYVNKGLHLNLISASQIGVTVNASTLAGAGYSGSIQIFYMVM